jgi:outer membrane protein
MWPLPYREYRSNRRRPNLGVGFAAFTRLVMSVGLASALASSAWAQTPARTHYAPIQRIPLAAEAVSVDQLDARWGTMTFVQRAAVIDQLIQLAEYDKAERYLQGLAADNPGQQLDVQFLRGALHKRRGQTTEAVMIFRAILADHPNATRARAELAETLFIQQNDDSARHHFDLLLGSGNAHTDQITRSYINAIDARRRWDFTSYVTLAPSTNLNQGAANGNIGDFQGLQGKLSDRNVKKAGVGIAGGAQAGYRQPLTDTLDLMVSGGVSGRRYQDNRFDTHSGSISLGPRVRTPWGYVGLYGLADKSWAADDAHNASFGGQLSTLTRFNAANVFYADFVCSRRRFNTSWDNTDLSYQDGRSCAVNNRLEHHLSSSSFVSVIGRVGQDKTETRHLDNHSLSGGVGYFTDLPFGLSIYSQILVSHAEYAGKYPTFDHARKDNKGELSLQLTKRDWQLMGLAPSLQYTYTRNFSNIDFLSFDAHGVNLTLTKKF